VYKQAVREGIHRLSQNWLTRHRDPIQYYHRYQDADIITYRQLLGDISKEEISELNSAFGTPNGLYFTKGYKEPASILGWKTLPLMAYWGIGAGFAGYAKFIKGYNILWFVAPFVPLWMLLYYQYVRQPTQQIENAYKYLLAKRAATCEHEQNRRKFDTAKFAKTPELQQLQEFLRSRNMTLYQLEADLVDRINNGELRA